MRPSDSDAELGGRLRAAKVSPRHGEADESCTGVVTETVCVPCCLLYFEGYRASERRDVPAPHGWCTTGSQGSQQTCAVQDFAIEDFIRQVASDEADLKAATEIHATEEAAFSAEEKDLVETIDADSEGCHSESGSCRHGLGREHLSC